MSRRALVIGDRVCIRPEAVESLKREGYLDIEPHVAGKVNSTWVHGGRRVLQLDLLSRFRWADSSTASLPVSVWAGQVRLADGAAERARLRTEAHVATLVAAKAAREAMRMVKPNRRKRK